MADAVAFRHDIAVQSRPRDLDRAIAALAQRQHGVVARYQLLKLGLDRGAILYRLQCGRLHLIHRGVYAVGHRVLSANGWRMAAVLAGGPRAVLSHRSAAALWALRGSAPQRADVTVPSRRHARVGIQWHFALLPPDEVTTVRGIRVTTVPRTIFDVAAGGTRQEVERVRHEAEVLRLTDPLSLHDLLDRYPRRKGSAVVRAVLAEQSVVPKDVFTHAFIAFLDSHGLPRPELNVYLTLAGHLHEIDCLWRRQGVAVELDGRAAHDTARAFESDRLKDRRLSVARWRPIRVTWRQLSDEPAPLARDLRALLA